jgi:glycosyltransferase involved in cell wall biosynthesis
MSPRVSVVIPTRNRRGLLVETIASVRRQEGVTWELLVVDDASTDDTAAYLAGLQDPRITVLTQAQASERSAARNRGLQAARGEFVMFLDDDDLLRPAALLRLAEALDQAPRAVMASGALRFRETEHDSTLRYYLPEATTCPFSDALLFGWWANSGQNLFRITAAREAGGFDPELAACEDRKFLFAIAKLGPLRTVRQVVLDYRLHAGQSKPANLDQIREGVYREFIAGLSPAQQRRAGRIRRAAGRFAKGGRGNVMQAMLLAPALLLDPLLRRQIWWAWRDNAPGCV